MNAVIQRSPFALLREMDRARLAFLVGVVLTWLIMMWGAVVLINRPATRLGGSGSVYRAPARPGVERRAPKGSMARLQSAVTFHVMADANRTEGQ